MDRFMSAYQWAVIVGVIVGVVMGLWSASNWFSANPFLSGLIAAAITLALVFPMRRLD